VPHKHQPQGPELADLTASVIGDLTWLRDTDLRTADEATLRDLSSKLRRLLIDGGGTLQKLRRARGLKGEPRVVTIELPDATGSDVVFAQAGGMQRQGGTVSHTIIRNRAMSAEEVKASYEAMKGGPKEVERPLSNWLSSGCMKAGGVVITRRVVIQFVANKLGGVHYDPKRNAKKDAGYLALDRAREGFEILGLDAVYGQLTAIGQQLWASPDVQAMVP